MYHIKKRALALAAALLLLAGCGSKADAPATNAPTVEATGEKITVALAELESAVKALLDHIHDNLYAMALKNREDNTFDIQTPEEAKAIVEGKGGFLRSKWCGSLECELAMKERAGVSSRCMPLVQSGTEGTCPVCGRKCTTDIYWGVAY